MKPVVLIVLDGWGIAPEGPGNAITLSRLPFYHRLLGTYPHGMLQASGEAVGLPRGEDGNTETGHMNLGAGYIVYQNLPRINLGIADGSFFKNQAFAGALDHARKYESNLHLLGLIGSGGVHSNIEHLLALLQLCKEQGFTRVFLHLITDGRDSPPKSAQMYVEQVESYLKNLGFGEIASIMGRYYALDRDLRWERTEKAYRALTQGIDDAATTPQEAIEKSYANNITDEFIKPTIITREGKPRSLIRENDSVIFFNYRIDRPRQLTKAFVLDNFEEEANISDFDPFAVKYFKKHTIEISSLTPPFPRGPKIPHLYFVTMTEYSKNVHASNVVFSPHIVVHPIGESISQAGFSQLRVAESEKERFVTYYFNGQREAQFIGEDRLIIPSPKVATYDLVPEMSAYALTEAVIKKLAVPHYDFILINYANVDMVAHTGSIPATVKACETIDKCLSKLVPKVLARDGAVFITADHGNAEELLDPRTGGIDTEHSTYPVPFLAISRDWEGKSVTIPTGVLADVAPTILSALRIEIPDTMTGRNLLLNTVD